MRNAPKDYQFWAKLKQDDQKNVIAFHPLPAHSADVAAVTESLLRHTILNQRIASLIGWQLLSETHISRISAMAAIHDAGKVNHGFQNRMYKKKQPRAGHVSPMIEVLAADENYQEKILIPLGIQKMMQWFSGQDAVAPFLRAVWGHHGRPTPIQNKFKTSLWKCDENRNPIDGLKELGNAVEQWFPKAFSDKAQPFPSDPILQHTFNGLLTLSDWLGSDTRFFKFAEYDESYIEQARANANRAVESLFLKPDKARSQLGNHTIGFSHICDFQPYNIQQQCLDLPLHQNGSLTILESDTGSGKTEAAIARFTRLYQEGMVDGMYFAVPTRSAATQLYDRVVEATKRAFPEDDARPPVVQAVSGYIKVDAVEGVPLPKFDVKWPEEKSEMLRERSWAAEHPKRYLAGAIVVGTIDQVLLSTLQVNHAHMRATALLRHFLVVDEVHSSDAYMTKLLDRVLDYHLKAGGHGLLMSATLGTATRLHLTTRNNQKLPTPDKAKEIDYPLLTHVDAARKNPETCHAASSGKQKNVKTVIKNIADSPGDIATFAADQAKKGASILIIRNLVKDCIKTQKALEELLGTDSDLLFQINAIPAPHHSRFAPEDRKKLDQEIEHYFGKNSESRSVIAVATQTVEQSLDIDADLLITDLCPIDVLLQRIGRLHRHDRERPTGFETAQCIVLTPEERALSDTIDNNGQGSKGKHGLGTVYQDLRVIEATWRILEDDAFEYWQIPQHNRVLVERGTHPQILKSLVDELGEKWRQHQEHIAGQHYADRQLPKMVGIDFDEPFGETGFAEELNHVKTRLGREDYQVFLPERLTGPFGETVEEMTITEWQLDVVPEESQLREEAVQSFEGGFSFKYYGKTFRYDRFGLDEYS